MSGLHATVLFKEVTVGVNPSCLHLELELMIVVAFLQDSYIVTRRLFSHIAAVDFASIH